MVNSEFIKVYESYRDLVEKRLRDFSIPEFTYSDENKVYENILCLRKQRTQLMKLSLSIRTFKEKLRKPVATYRFLKDKKIQENVQQLSGLKTKEERQAVINALVNSEDFTWDDLMDGVEELLQQIHLAISELQKAFDEYEFLYNLSRLNSMGYLLKQAEHKLNDVVGKD